VTPPGLIAAGTGAPDDAVLAHAAAAGDADAMTALLERHFDYVHAICLRALRDPAAAEDARQETLLRIATRIRSFDHRSSFRTWVFAIARNVVLNELRARRREPVPSAGRSAAVADPGRGLDARLDLMAALDQLPPARREVIVLRYLCDLPYEEIAEVLGIPLNTVRTRLRRALGNLRVILGNSAAAHGVEARQVLDVMEGSSD
jgi:RNA polymerase sigma-70 factor (ECF subfamily)